LVSLKPEELSQGQTVSGNFLLVEKSLMPFTNKPGKYLSVRLRNKTGMIWGKLWNDGEEVFSQIESDSIVEVTGIIKTFNNEYEMHLETIAQTGSPVVPEEFLPVAENIKEVEQDFLDTLDWVKSIVPEPYASLVDEMFQRSFWEKFCRAPAAIKLHHAYLGGLMEHTANVTVNSYNMAARYEHADKTLVLLGALFHDIGKVDEFAYEATFDYSSEGALLGHIFQGCMMLKNALKNLEARGIEIPGEFANLLLHIITSHHGYLEWGSPKQPAIFEASIVHYADMLDADAYKFLEEEVEEGKSIWSNKLKKFIYGRREVSEASSLQEVEEESVVFEDEDDIPF